jgi:hypothetical protein
MYICVKPLDQPQGPAFPLEWGFMDDTGSAIMTINKSDLTQLMTYNQTATGRIPPSPPLLGAIVLGVADGRRTMHICRRLAVNLRNVGTSTYLSPIWHPIQVAIHNDDIASSIPRLNGPWARHRLYTASVPDRRRTTYFSEDHPSLMTLPWSTPLEMNRLLPDHRLYGVQAPKAP